MSRKSIAPGPQPTYRSQLFQEQVHDAYKASAKLPTPTLCAQCGAVYAEGRWQWLPRPQAAHTESCPACQRIRDRFPAGYVRIEGDFAAGNRAALLQIARNLEKKENAAHPLQRIMDVVEENGGVLITTTDVHLAHGIGEALQRAYKGTLDSRYSREEKLVRVRWAR